MNKLSNDFVVAQMEKEVARFGPKPGDPITIYIVVVPKKDKTPELNHLVLYFDNENVYYMYGPSFEYPSSAIYYETGPEDSARELTLAQIKTIFENVKD